MPFTVSENVTILFKGWKTTSLASMVCSVIFVFLFSILYEFLKAYRMYNQTSRKCSPERTPLLKTRQRNQIGLERRLPPKFCLRQHIVNTFFYLLNFVFAYFLMLIAMTYNVWLFLSIVLGYGVGYFVAQPLCQHYLANDLNQQETSASSGIADQQSGNVVL